MHMRHSLISDEYVCILFVLGTDKERGMVEWRKYLGTTEKQTDSSETLNCYDMPYGMEKIKKVKAFAYIPFCPTFTGWSLRNRKTSDDSPDPGPATLNKAPKVGDERIC